MGDGKMLLRFPHYFIFLFLGIAAVALWLLEKLSRADALPGRYVITSATVYDTKTKLTWQAAPAPSLYTWIEATQYCALLGTNDAQWRLPSVKELGTLVDESRSNPAIDPAAFPATPPKYFWTSSPVATFPRYAWTVDFNHGGDTFFDVTFPELVRCVH